MPAILSIYNYVSKIVIINSNVSWTGWKGNTCIAEIDKLKNIDTQNKIVSLRYDTTDQTAQVDYGFTWIKKNLRADYAMILDSDEVWDDSDLVRALDYIHARPNRKVYRCQMRTYIKHPLYRLSNIELCQPVVFVNAKLPDMGGGWRANNLEGPVMPGVFFHHFIHVRKDFNSVFEKIITSHASEGYAYQNMGEWIPQVWDKLPELTGKWKAGFHPNTEYPASWKGIEVISKDQLPNVLKNNSFDILERFGIMTEEREAWRPEPTRQFVIDPIRNCSINPPCKFCYHLHTQNSWSSYTWPWEKTKQCIDDGIARGNTHCQVTGGEPTIYPHIHALIEYALSRGVKTSIITNGIVSQQKAESLIASGLDSFLVSRHGLKATHDYITNRIGNYDRQVEFLNFIRDKIELRFNCVISKFNQKEIILIAEEMAAFKPKRVSWIFMNPHEAWAQDAESTGQVIADLDIASPLLNQAIAYLESAGIIASVRYFPFCRLDPKYWGNIYNDKTWFACDTKVRLLNGTSPTIKELADTYKAGEKFWVYSLNDNNELVPGLAHSPRITKKNAQCVELTLDNGDKITCTPDHLLRTRRGDYVF